MRWWPSRHWSPDAMVIDVDMRGSTGFAASSASSRSKRLRTSAPSSTPREQSQRRSAMDAGAYDFIAKGEVTLLREALERWPGSSEPSAPSR